MKSCVDWQLTRWQNVAETDDPQRSRRLLYDFEKRPPIYRCSKIGKRPQVEFQGILEGFWPARILRKLLVDSLLQRWIALMNVVSYGVESLLLRQKACGCLELEAVILSRKT